MKSILSKLQKFMKSEAVLCISALAAIITMFFVPPQLAYIEYLDLRVLALLFGLMAVVAGLKETGVFMVLSDKLLKKVVGVRSLGFVLILLCFFTSMWITNDVALITFVPFAIMVLSLAGQTKHMITIIVLQTIAANLGSMLTPVGNPQNLYLYSNFQVPILEFLQITLPYTVISLFFICISILFIKKETISITVPVQTIIDKRNSRLILMYCLLFALCLACVLHIIDYRFMLVIIVFVVLIFDRKVIKNVDYLLLLTFLCFFIFVGNIRNIPLMEEALATLLNGRTLPVTILASQFISNVPAAVLLSGFTNDYKGLILGTDIGGLGTLVASLASLISFKFYCKLEDAKPGRFLLVFTIYNAIFLVGLCVFYLIAQI